VNKRVCELIKDGKFNGAQMRKM